LGESEVVPSPKSQRQDAGPPEYPSANRTAVFAAGVAGSIEKAAVGSEERSLIAARTDRAKTARVLKRALVEVIMIRKGILATSQPWEFYETLNRSDID
jgi:hypothetical protein